MGIEIKVGNRYIIRGERPSNNRDFFKIKILEITDYTYLIKDLDAGVTYRSGIHNFNNDYKVLEALDPFDINELMDMKHDKQQ